MKKAILGLFLILLVTACNKYSYPENKEISDKSGAIIDTSAGFIPRQILFDGITHTYKWDENRLNEINNYYLDAREPVLYNFYLDREIYRLALLENKKDPIILSFNKENANKAWLVSKRINRDSIDTHNTLEGDTAVQRPLLWVNFDVSTKELKKKDIQTFDSIFQTIDFFNISNNEIDQTYDSYYLLEVHQEGKYGYVYRKLDDQSLSDLAKYMRSFSRY